MQPGFSVLLTCPPQGDMNRLGSSLCGRRGWRRVGEELVPQVELPRRTRPSSGDMCHFCPRPPDRIDQSCRYLRTRIKVWMLRSFGPFLTGFHWCPRNSGQPGLFFPWKVSFCSCADASHTLCASQQLHVVQFWFVTPLGVWGARWSSAGGSDGPGLLPCSTSAPSSPVPRWGNWLQVCSC